MSDPPLESASGSSVAAGPSLGPDVASPSGAPGAGSTQALVAVVAARAVSCPWTSVSWCQMFKKGNVFDLGYGRELGNPPQMKPTRDSPKSAILSRRRFGSIRMLAGFKSLLVQPTKN